MVNFRRNTPAEDEGDSTLKGNNFLFVVDMVVTQSSYLTFVIQVDALPTCVCASLSSNMRVSFALFSCGV